MKFRFDSGTKREEIRKVSIDGFNIHYSFIADAVNTPPKGANLHEIRVKAILHQAGQKTELVNSTLAPLHADYFASTPKEDAIAMQPLDSLGMMIGFETVTETATVKGEYQGLTPIRFTGGIVLKDDDYIELEVTMGSSAFHADNDNDSYIVVEPNEVVTNQMYVPTIEVLPVEAGRNEFARAIGDNVQTMSLLSIDKNCKTTQTPFLNVDLVCDKLKYDRSFQEMIAIRNLAGDSLSTKNYTPLLRGEDFDGVELNVTLDPTNVTNGNCYVVIRGYEMDDLILEKGARRRAKHARKNREKFLGKA